MSYRISMLAKNLRGRPTEAEKALWNHLRGKQLAGLKFRRQEPIRNYIADYVCFEKKIVVEIDGGGHAIEKERDVSRDDWLRSEGFIVLKESPSMNQGPLSRRKCTRNCPIC